MNFFDQLVQGVTSLVDSFLYPASDLPAMLVQAATLQIAKDYQAALTICDQILRMDPANPAAYQIRGLAKLGLNEYRGASEDLRIAQSLRIRRRLKEPGN